MPPAGIDDEMAALPARWRDAYIDALERICAAGDRATLLRDLLQCLHQHLGCSSVAFLRHEAWQHALLAEAATGAPLALDPARVLAALTGGDGLSRATAAALSPDATFGNGANFGSGANFDNGTADSVAVGPLYLADVICGTTRLGVLAIAAGRELDAAERAFVGRLLPRMACAIGRQQDIDSDAALIVRAHARDAALLHAAADTLPRGVLAHELREPLNLVIGFSEVLRDGLAGRLTQRQREYAGEILEAGRRLLARIDALLGVPGGAPPPELPHVLPAHDRKARGRRNGHLPLALVIEDDPSSAQLMQELLESAGMLVHRADSAEAAWALLAREIPELITLDILLPGADGWDFLARIKAMPALSRVPVLVVSVLGDADRGLNLGAARSLQKPVAREDFMRALGELGLAPPAAGGAAPRVLVVDDDRKAVAILASYLEAANCHTLAAYGGEEAIAVARREHPDAIVLDLLMPEVSGFDVVDALRRDPATLGIPILVVTAKDLDADDRDRLDDHIRAVIAKSSFDRAAFVAEVRRILAGRLPS